MPKVGDPPRQCDGTVAPFNPLKPGLTVLAIRANTAHRLGEDRTRKAQQRQREALEHYRKAGEALLQAKEQCGHGNWLPWLKAKVKFSQQRVSEYTRLAEGWHELPPGGNFTLKEALLFIAKQRCHEEEGQAGEERPKKGERNRDVGGAGADDRTISLVAPSAELFSTFNELLADRRKQYGTPDDFSTVLLALQRDPDQPRKVRND